MFPFHHSTVAPMGPWALGVHTADEVHPSVSDASAGQSSASRNPPHQRQSRCCQAGPLAGRMGTRPHNEDHQDSHSSQLRPLGSLGSNVMG